MKTEFSNNLETTLRQVPVRSRDLEETCEITQPLGASKFWIVKYGDRELAFSYETLIGYRIVESVKPDTVGRVWSDWVVRVNEWGPTTGKQMNYLHDQCWQDKNDRIQGSEFLKRFETEVD